ncbi:unnamed protein product [Prunus brigantina]
MSLIKSSRKRLLRIAKMKMTHKNSIDSLKIDFKLAMKMKDGRSGNISDRFWPPVQEYTTEFHNQAMVLDIDVNDYDVFMKYIGGLADYIRKEPKLFTIDTIEEATVKAIAIAAKNKRTDKKDDRSKPIIKTNWQKNGKQSKEGQTQKAEELLELKQPDVTLTLMTRPAYTEDTYNREELFHVNIQSSGDVTLSTLSLSPTQCSNIGKLHEKFKDLFQDVHGLTPRRAVEHDI